MRALYVQYGCGLSAPPSWRNFDSSPSLRLQRLPLLGAAFHGGSFPEFPANVEYGDILRGLPVASASCRAVYCSHVLEHLALEDLAVALANTRSLLEPGGAFRFVVPDLEHMARAYVSSDQPAAALEFVEATNLGRARRARGLRGYAKELFGAEPHKWMWDFKAMAVQLERAGFREIRRAALGDGGDPLFGDVEDPGRWRDCLGMHCVR